MKKFIVAALLAAAFLPASACYFGAATHNMYMMNVFGRQCVAGDAYQPDFSPFWIQYTGIKPTADKADSYYSSYAKAIQLTARKKADTEMTAYTQVLNNYLTQAHAFDNLWDYPTKAQLLQRRQQLLRVLTAARQYRGSRLSAQYALLRMRCNIILKKHQDNLLFWQQTASKLPASPYRDMMQNIYAGALLNSGKRHDAMEIYAQQQDWRSINIGLYHYRNLAGIKQIYAEDTNAAPLPYLVQYFVNSAQETLDSKPEGVNRIGMPDYHETTPQEVNEFIAFASSVIQAKKTRTPILWQTAVGMLQYLYHQGNALQTMDEAMKMDGTQTMKNCARCVRLLCSVAPASMDDAYSQYLQKEFEWLSTNAAKTPYYGDVMDRVIYLALIPKYRQIGRPEMVTALLADIKFPNWSSNPSNIGHPKTYDSANNMNDLFVDHIDTLSANEIIRDVKFMKSSPSNVFEHWVLQHSFLDSNYYNDNIGTHMLAEGRFAEAADYLRQVPVSYLREQSIAWYMANRKWNIAPWFLNQRNSEDYWNYDKKAWVHSNVYGKETLVKATPADLKAPDAVRDSLHALKQLQKMTVNPKLAFAEEMNKLEASYTIANDTARQNMAYRLAVRYVQASYCGDCWWLTKDSWSCSDSIRPKTKDFLTAAQYYLEVSAQSAIFQQQQQSIYALAWIPAEPWYESRMEYPGDNGKTQVYIDRTASHFTYPKDIDKSSLVINRQSSQYKHLLRLASFADAHRTQVSTYITKCDMLQQFRQCQKGV